MGSALPRIVYIAGYGRSGSTVLDAVLGAHPEILGVGEVNTFLVEHANGGVCSCGETIAECILWQPVVDGLKREIGDVESSTLIDDAYDAEATSGLIDRPAERRAKARRAGLLWRTFYAEVAEASGCDIIVDSSKTARFCVRRPLRLARDAGLELQIIHLVRDPRAVVYSERRRGSNARLERGSKGNGIGGVLRPVIGWLMANASVEIYRRWLLADVAVMRVRYEDFMADPSITIVNIAEFIGVSPQPIVSALDHDDGIEPGHGVGGNRLRRAGPIVLRYDEAWKANADWAVRAAGLLSAALASRYGYGSSHWTRRHLGPSGSAT